VLFVKTVDFSVDVRFDEDIQSVSLLKSNVGENPEEVAYKVLFT
jgi:hypothetical protein